MLCLPIMFGGRGSYHKNEVFSLKSYVSLNKINLILLNNLKIRRFNYIICLYSFKKM